jgi:hypothetical protein
MWTTMSFASANSHNHFASGLLPSDLFPFPVRLEKPEAVGSQRSIPLVVGIRPERARVSSTPILDGVPGRVVRKFRGVAGQYLVAILKLAKIAKAVGLPTVLTTSMEDHAQGPLVPELEQILPDEFKARINTLLVATCLPGSTRAYH